jgi:hypothetical protein
VTVRTSIDDIELRGKRFERDLIPRSPTTPRVSVRS